MLRGGDSRQTVTQRSRRRAMMLMYSRVRSKTDATTTTTAWLHSRGTAQEDESSSAICHLRGAGGGSMALIVAALTREKGASAFDYVTIIKLTLHSLHSTLPTSDLQFQLSHYFFAFLPSELSVFGFRFLGTVFFSDFTTATTSKPSSFNILFKYPASKSSAAR